MAKISVELKIMCWATVEVEVDDVNDLDSVSDAALNHEDAPGGITVGAFGPCTSVDTDEWELHAITDKVTGDKIWSSEGGYVKKNDAEVTAEIKPTLPTWV